MGAVLQKELLIPKVLEKLGKKEGNNHPMASDYILYPLGRPYCLTALGELCDFQEKGKEFTLHFHAQAFPQDKLTQNTMLRLCLQRRLTLLEM